MRVACLFIIALLACFDGFGQNLEETLRRAIQNNSALKHNDSLSKTIDLGSGLVNAPIVFTNKRTGTKDSYKGELAKENFIIHYDIGKMAGAHMNEKLKGQCSYYADTIMNGYRTSVGLIKQNGQTNLKITIWGDYPSAPFTFPANFWSVVKNEREVQDVMAIAMSYRPDK
ncbi:MAG: hypothetical protein ACO1OQ_16810 [Rufibacter sp.]